ncbi:Autophagy-related protein 18 F (Atg18F) [Monocercomonoides exilis]|uniref:Autophagy-related protein 18 F (Atg18F) n=1 Tax=Monocercomonoides exilis TaxID=2049356 RepID=UPI0035599629|nr:Autophagy-related protein 18 F (Atg18F) [Monocercomonoides exilis]|eukprot:MONOS_777.1-p1 / transcript=MONOS_777.1 / gene=MONOS_777 / organism=Monocercomonoides_exilis_PA203 / gene_product=Autophagy-related protein 18 F (Atg18F) / transcript_product=Autophagy-related protein 18 F (Atg18F) / location=Mono_scaffold00013:76540-78777(+) / protein_length=578 / sequence_SO=supercontig / SO=protein_coding / is_pseudo=false
MKEKNVKVNSVVYSQKTHHTIIATSQFMNIYSFDGTWFHAFYKMKSPTKLADYLPSLGLIMTVPELHPEFLVLRDHKSENILAKLTFHNPLIYARFSANMIIAATQFHLHVIPIEDLRAREIIDLNGANDLNIVISQDINNLVIAAVSNPRECVTLYSLFKHITDSFQVEDEPVRALALNSKGTKLATSPENGKTITIFTITATETQITLSPYLRLKRGSSPTKIMNMSFFERGVQSNQNKEDADTQMFENLACISTSDTLHIFSAENTIQPTSLWKTPTQMLKSATGLLSSMIWAKRPVASSSSAAASSAESLDTGYASYIKGRLDKCSGYTRMQKEEKNEKRTSAKFASSSRSAVSSLSSSSTSSSSSPSSSVSSPSSSIPSTTDEANSLSHGENTEQQREVKLRDAMAEFGLESNSTAKNEADAAKPSTSSSLASFSVLDESSLLALDSPDAQNDTADEACNSSSSSSSSISLAQSSSSSSTSPSPLPSSMPPRPVSDSSSAKYITYSNQMDSPDAKSWVGFLQGNIIAITRKGDVFRFPLPSLSSALKTDAQKPANLQSVDAQNIAVSSIFEE